MDVDHKDHDYSYTTESAALDPALEILCRDNVKEEMEGSGYPARKVTQVLPIGL